VIINGLMPLSREREFLRDGVDPPKHVQRIDRLFAEDFGPTESQLGSGEGYAGGWVSSIDGR
jgi:hypothetical protein